MGCMCLFQIDLMTVKALFLKESFPLKLFISAKSVIVCKLKKQ